MVLVRLARQSDIGLGQRLEKDCHGSKLLVVRHPTNGSVSVLDAHCFHQGTPLVGGDIEDLQGHACIVCPAHKYRIDLATGCKVDTDLQGRVCAMADQKQRIYRVHTDSEFIFVDMPDVRGPPLASDYYNQRQQLPQQQQQQQQRRAPELPTSQNYGLFGSASPAAAAAAASPPLSPLQPYAAYSAWPVVPASADKVAKSPQLVLSQESSGSPPQPAMVPTRINFPAAKADPPHIARRKAATAAILAKSYRPPQSTDSTPMQSPMKPAPPAAAAAAPPAVKTQKTLFEAWGARPLSSAPDDAMDTDN